MTIRITVLLLLSIMLTGCAWPETRVRFNRDPETGAITADLERGLMAGPVDITFAYEAPDGTTISGSWRSDPNLDAWQNAQALQQANISKALDLAGAAAKGGGVP